MSHIRGRFNKQADNLVTRYTASLPFDYRLYRQDINGSIAHTRMLAKQNIISDEEAHVIISGLESIRGEIDQGAFEFRNELEDIHMAVESRLIEKIGGQVIGITFLIELVGLEGRKKIENYNVRSVISYD